MSIALPIVKIFLAVKNPHYNVCMGGGGEISYSRSIIEAPFSTKT